MDTSFLAMFFVIVANRFGCVQQDDLQDGIHWQAVSLVQLQKTYNSI
jgi:hypothetical protein